MADRERTSSHGGAPGPNPGHADDEGFGERLSWDFLQALGRPIRPRRDAPADEGAGAEATANSPDMAQDHGAPHAEAPASASPPAKRPKPAKSHHHGHRARLRERFLNAGQQSLADYELLELVLFRAIPQRDVKPIAKRLIEHFGDFNRVISAPVPRLNEVPGIGPAVICELKIVEAAAHRLARAKVMHRSVLSSWSELMAYCKTAMAHRETEQFRILFLDRKNVLIADEEQAKGTVDHVPVYPREVVKRALELNASAMILVHNHPSGDPTPSRADIDMTKLIDKAVKAVGITLHDHVIVGQDSDLSFRAQGLI